MTRGRDRGVSVTVNYALNLAVAAVLLAGVLTATGGMVDDRRASAARTELSVVGQRLAADLGAADRLAAAGTDDPTVTASASLPDRVAGVGYRVAVEPGRSKLVLATDDPDVNVTVGFHTETPVKKTTVRGGDLRIELSDDGDLEVSEA